MRQKVLLPSSSNNLKSLTYTSCSDLESYLQETDVSSLCTFNSKKVIEVYHNYISNGEIKDLEHILLKAQKTEDKYLYIKGQKTNLQYDTKREKAFNAVEDSKALLSKIKNKTFFDNWYEHLLYEVLCKAAMHKKHILYEEIVEHVSPYMKDKINSAKSKLGTSFNKEIVRRVIDKLVSNYLKILPTSSGVKASLLSYMKCIDIDDYRGRMNYDAVNHRIISRANEVILDESIVQNNLSHDVEEGLQYIIDNMDVSLLIAVEQEILNEIAERAANHRERDSKKKDLELLVISNGGEFQDKLALPTNLSFSEIERLYEDMLLIKFKEKGERESHTLYERLPLLELEEIKEAFPASITDGILKNMEESLNKYVEVVKKAKKEIVDKVFVKKENLEKLYELEQELEFNFIQKLFYSNYYKKYQGVKSFFECKSFISDNISSKKDSSFRGKLEEQLRKLDKPKREELERVLLSSIDNEFQALANQLTSRKDELKKKSEEEFFLPKLLHPSHWESYIKREENSLKICEEALRKSAATGDDELFYQAVKDIKKNSKYMWIFQVNETLFNNIYKTQHDSKNKMLSFRELAEKFIGNRKKYITDQLNECKIRKATSAQHLVNMELTEKDMENQEKLNDMAIKNEMLAKKAEEAEARAEEERRAKEEAEAKIKAIDLLYDEADDQKISRKKIKQNEDVHKFLECQYTFLILNVDSTEKFESLCRKYKDLKEEVKKPNFEKLLELTNEFERLSIKFVEREKEEEESRENIPECNEQNIDRLKLSIVTRVVQAREIVERAKRTVEKEKIEVEEIIKQLQMQTPDTAFSSMNHEPVAGPSWKK